MHDFEIMNNVRMARKKSYVPHFIVYQTNLKHRLGPPIATVFVHHASSLNFLPLNLIF